jgi:hypothetical protein
MFAKLTKERSRMLPLPPKSSEMRFLRIFLIEKSRFYLKLLQESWQLLQKRSRKLSLTNWV